MQIELANKELIVIQKMVMDLVIKGAVNNRARFRVGKLLENRINDLNDDRTALLKDYVKFDVSGNPIVKDNEYQFNAGKEFEYRIEFNKLDDEKTIITIDDYVPQFKKFLELLNDYDGELSGSDGYAFGLLAEKIEEAFEDAKNN